MKAKWIFVAGAAVEAGVAMWESLHYEYPLLPFALCLVFASIAWVEDEQ